MFSIVKSIVIKKKNKAPMDVRLKRINAFQHNAAFSKRFVGAGHSEEGGGPGGEGTLPSARRPCTFRGVWEHYPSEIF